MRTTEEKLRACPTCGAKGRTEQMGLRDYGGWLFDILPGRVAATDLDFVLEQHSTGRILVLEFKPNLYVPRGQALLFDTITKVGWDVWVVDDSKKDEYLTVMPWDTGTEVTISLPEFKAKVRDWWDDGLA